MLGNKYSNAVRMLGVQQIMQANSGHTGIVLGIADVVSELFKNHLVFNPKDPKWLGRDRFILSAGHGSAMLYALLYLSGYEDITIDDLKNFRQLGSKTAGHPEFDMLGGVEISTGPLGQGIANAVGMALGQKILSERYGELFNSKVYCVVGDGCLMEGISYEATAFAGHHKLKNLIVIHDDNNITIDGKVDLVSSESQLKRFENCGFEVLQCDGHNIEEINICFEKAKNSDKPVFIQCHTHIGYGCLKQDSNKIHGAPLSDEEYNDLKEKFEWKNEPFEIDIDLLNEWRSFWKRNEEYYNSWKEKYNKSDKKDDIKNFFEGKLSISQDNQNKIIDYFKNTEKEATRKSSGKILEVMLADNKQIIGGTADLGGSIMSYNSSCKVITQNDKSGNYIHYGIREGAMGAIMNGLATCGFVPYAGTFLVFCYEYMTPIRMSALMNLPVIHILTHDSFYVGEDGATHQPIEQLDVLRLIPNLMVFRPCDIEETLACYNTFLQFKKPCCMILSRQNLPQIHNKEAKIESGAYTIYKTENINEKDCDITILTSGSEVELSINSAKLLEKKGKNVRVVSIYCLELLKQLSKEKQEKILYADNEKQKIVAIEAGTCMCLGNLSKNGLVINITTFGKSGKGSDLADYFGFTPDKVVKRIEDHLGEKK